MRLNSYKMFYDRTRKMWPFITGDCLIEVTAWAVLTLLLNWYLLFLRDTHWDESAKTGWLGVRTMFPSRATCLRLLHRASAIKIYACWSSTMRTSTSHQHVGLRWWFWRLTTLSTTFQLYRGGQFYCWWKLEYGEKSDKIYHLMLYRVHLIWVGLELTTWVVIATDSIGSCTPDYHTTTTTLAIYQNDIS